MARPLVPAQNYSIGVPSAYMVQDPIVACLEYRAHPLQTFLGFGQGAANLLKCREYLL